MPTHPSVQYDQSSLRSTSELADAPQDGFRLSQVGDTWVPVSQIANPHFEQRRSSPLHACLAGKVAVDVIHGGNIVPADLPAELPPQLRPAVAAGFDREKDWGADHFADELARQLNLSGFLNVDLARVVLDFNRFPGVTRGSLAYLQRAAINHPFSELSFDAKKTLLNDCYDSISSAFDQHLEGAVLKLAVHTYDRYNAGGPYEVHGTVRPDVSLLYTSLSYDQYQRLNQGVFDPLYPDALGHFTCDRRLAARLTLELEKRGITVAHNHPYQLPDGSVEIRSQVWHFFRFLRQRFEETRPDTVEQWPYRLVWNMLLDTTQRSASSSLLRSYIHGHRRLARSELIGHVAENRPGDLQSGLREELQRARRAYEDIGAYLEADRRNLIQDYRRHPLRLGAMALEVRKDLLWRFEDEEEETYQKPVHGRGGLKTDNLRVLAEAFSEALVTYSHEDRCETVERQRWS